MHIVVCVKQVPDPNVPSSVFQLDENSKKVVLPGRSPVISPYDEQAIEVALRLREKSANPNEVKITALTMADAPTAKMMKNVLALGVDEGVVLDNSDFMGSDGYATAYSLAAAIQKIGDVDLVLAGRQAADTDAGIVGIGIAELLGMPAVTFAKRIDLDGDEARVVRVVGDSEETVGAPLPLVITVSHEIGAVRHPNLRETMKAGKKPIHYLDPDALEIDAGRIGVAGSRRVVERLYQPVHEVNCEWLVGAEPVALAKTLAAKLIERKLL